MCPVEEASCEDFGEAVDACEHNCFKREADGAPVLDVGTATEGYPWCPAGECCVDYNIDISCLPSIVLLKTGMHVDVVGLKKELMPKALRAVIQHNFYSMFHNVVTITAKLFTNIEKVQSFRIHESVGLILH